MASACDRCGNRGIPLIIDFIPLFLGFIPLFFGIIPLFGRVGEFASDIS
jgi:hypothetical protein